MKGCSRGSRGLLGVEMKTLHVKVIFESALFGHISCDLFDRDTALSGPGLVFFSLFARRLQAVCQLRRHASRPHPHSPLSVALSVASSLERASETMSETHKRY